jgi:hypothetical protein
MISNSVKYQEYNTLTINKENLAVTNAIANAGLRVR